MKLKLLISIALSPFIFLLCGTYGDVETPKKHDFVAHEWGTFTTLHGSDGGRLSGLEVSEEPLPGFVYSHAANPGPEAQKKDLAEGFYGYGAKGNLYLPSAVNVKMETPVIYFYSDEERDVKVRADFPQGSINEWYPHRSRGEVKKSYHNFTTPYEGWIEWDATILGPGSAEPLTAPKELETAHWTAPRVKDANNVAANGEIENFLFYRGLANFDIPMQVNFTDPTTLSITNGGSDAIPYVFVYEKTEAGKSRFWWSGQVGSGGNQSVDLSGTPSTNPRNFMDFGQELVNAGLYEDEAKAMLNTWQESYFKRPGLRVFWIVPEQLVDELLPLSIKPAPKQVNRVFVGRCDVMTPEFEEELVSEGMGWSEFYNDRYYAGYLERAGQLNAERN